MSVVVILDASVLYPAITRSVLIYLALAELYQARWSELIQDEWTRNLLQNRPDLDPQRIARTRSLMDSRIPDAVVSGYEPLISTLTLPDPNDRHVLAAALHAGARVIVTANLKDFPNTVLATLNITAEHPDQFIRALLEVASHQAIEAFAIDRASMTKPPMTADEYLNALEHAGLVVTAAALRPHIDEL